MNAHINEKNGKRLMIAGAVGFGLGLLVILVAGFSAVNQVGGCGLSGSGTCHDLTWQHTGVTAGQAIWVISAIAILAAIAIMIASNPKKQLAALDPRDSLKPMSVAGVKQGTVRGLLIAIGAFVGSFLGVFISSLLAPASNNGIFAIAVFGGLFGGAALGAYVMVRFLRRKLK